MPPTPAGQGPTSLVSRLGKTPKSPSLPHGCPAQAFWELLPDRCELCWGKILQTPLIGPFPHITQIPNTASLGQPPTILGCCPFSSPISFLPHCPSENTAGSPGVLWNSSPGRERGANILSLSPCVAAISGGVCSSEREEPDGLMALCCHSQLCDMGQVPPDSEPVSSSG